MKPFFLLTGLLLLASHGAGFPAETKPRPFEKDIAAFEASDKTNRPPKGAILFVGDSTFTLWKSIHDDLPGFTVGGDFFGHGGAHATNMEVRPAKSVAIVWMVQHGGFPGDGGKAQGVFKNWALERFGK